MTLKEMFEFMLQQYSTIRYHIVGFTPDNTKLIVGWTDTNMEIIDEIVAACNPGTKYLIVSADGVNPHDKIYGPMALWLVELGYVGAEASKLMQDLKCRADGAGGVFDLNWINNNTSLSSRSLLIKRGINPDNLPSRVVPLLKK